MQKKSLTDWQGFNSWNIHLLIEKVTKLLFRSFRFRGFLFRFWFFDLAEIDTPIFIFWKKAFDLLIWYCLQIYHSFVKNQTGAIIRPNILVFFQVTHDSKLWCRNRCRVNRWHRTSLLECDCQSFFFIRLDELNTIRRNECRWIIGAD